MLIMFVCLSERRGMWKDGKNSHKATTYTRLQALYSLRSQQALHEQFATGATYG